MLGNAGGVVGMVDRTQGPMEKPIVFGTDGWRGVIAEDFTFERVRRVAIAAAQVLAGDWGEARPLILVGYDRRFGADRFALAAAEVLASRGFRVALANNYAPTPALSYGTKVRGAIGALVLTASHNPAPYLGLKVKGPFGGSVTETVTQGIEQLLRENRLLSPQGGGQVDYFDPWQDYLIALRGLVDGEAIRRAIAENRLLVVADVMYGAAAGGLSQLLDCPIGEIHSEPDPLFGGRSPEPLAQNLSHLQRALRRAQGEHPDRLTLGLVFDGDSDRIAAMDGSGEFFSSQKLIPLLMQHLAPRYPGAIVKTVSGSDLFAQIAQHLGREIQETPIGYKYIADRMMQQSILLGGEESGGIGYGHHIPERDALLSALYLLEMVVQRGQNLGEQYRQLQTTVRHQSHYDRCDLHLASLDLRDRLLQRLHTSPPTQIAGQEVRSCQTLDGYKFRLADNRWLLIRFSGTEPVLRLYCEAPTVAQVAATLAWARTWAQIP